MAIYSSLLPCTVILTLPLGAWFVFAGWSALPDLILVLCLSLSIGMPLLKSLGFLPTMPQLNYKISALEQVLDAPELQQTPDSFHGKDDTIVYDHVSFGYTKTQPGPDGKPMVVEDEVLHDISFTAKAGQKTALVGESGSGKSVFTKSFMGLLDANGSITSGTIDYYGADDGKPIRLSDLKKEKDWLKVRGHEIAMIMQDPMTSLNPLKTIGDQIMEAVELHQHLKGKAAREKTLEYLRDVGIADPEVRFAQYPHEFSGGMRQRVVIAIAVACNPQILICDEPTTALDVTIQAQILQLLKEMQVKYNLTIVLITHDLGVVANIADRVAVMYAGDIVEIGTSDEIYYDPRHPYTWALLSSMPQMGIKGEDLFNIQGTPPNLFTEIHGDAFAPRNPQALKIDFVKRPPYFTVSPTHKAKTWLLDPRAPKVEPPAAVKLLKEEGMQDA